MRQRFISVLFVFVCCFYEGKTQNWDVDITKSINPQNPNSYYWKVTSSSAYFVSAAVPFSLMVAGWIEKDPVLKMKSYEIFGAIAIDIINNAQIEITPRIAPPSFHSRLPTVLSGLIRVE